VVVTKLVQEAKEREKKKDEELEKFCSSVLIYAFVAKRLGINRRYLDNNIHRKAPPAANRYRSRIFSVAQSVLDSIKIEVVIKYRKNLLK
jgi:hypothetical protein